MATVSCTLCGLFWRRFCSAGFNWIRGSRQNDGGEPMRRQSDGRRPEDPRLAGRRRRLFGAFASFLRGGWGGGQRGCIRSHGGQMGEFLGRIFLRLLWCRRPMKPQSTPKASAACPLKSVCVFSLRVFGKICRKPMIRKHGGCG